MFGYVWIGMHVRAKWPRGWQMPDPWTTKNLLSPTPGMKGQANASQLPWGWRGGGVGCKGALRLASRLKTRIRATNNNNNNNNNNSNKIFIYTRDIYQYYTTLVLTRFQVNKIYNNIILNNISKTLKTPKIRLPKKNV